MSSAGIDAILFQESLLPVEALRETSTVSRLDLLRESERQDVPTVGYGNGPRRTPRQSLIVVLPENHVVSADLVASRLPLDDESDVDVILACAGQPHSIGALQRRVRDLQVLLAPAGTSPEDLRELAITQAQGDIVRLLLGTPGQA